ncbi:hypothetical protein ACFQ68_44880 [Amycolatopsis japonica]|uniref:hypothetical protein n=1 Tax=Amycolatopsis japonica TaxID=208439 RepID=UPI0036701493
MVIGKAGCRGVQAITLATGLLLESAPAVARLAPASLPTGQKGCLPLPVNTEPGAHRAWERMAAG